MTISEAIATYISKMNAVDGQEVRPGLLFFFSIMIIVIVTGFVIAAINTSFSIKIFCLEFSWNKKDR